MSEGAAAPRRHLRFSSGMRDVDGCSDEEQITQYGLDWEGIQLVTDLVRGTLATPSPSNNTITPEQKVLTTLRYLATGEVEPGSSGHDLGPQHTINTVIKETIYALSTIDVLSKFIKFPLTQEATAANARAFLRESGMHGIFGVIDGTHIKLSAPKEYGYEYINRKGEHTINVQVVFDHDYKFIDIVAMWPGSVHEARILRESPLFRICEGGHVPPGRHLLGDSAYPSRRWLLTPYLRPLPGPQTNYNRAHKRTRSVVEFGIGQWKQRFRVLRGEICIKDAAYVCRIVEVCAMLHNICKDRNVIIPEYQDRAKQEDENVAEEHRQVVPKPPRGRIAKEGLLYRDAYVNLHFKVARQPQAGRR